MALKSHNNHSVSRARSFVAVIGHGPMLEREEGGVATLRQLGAFIANPGAALLDDLFFEREIEQGSLHVQPR